MEIPKNVSVLSVERAGALDRYGQPIQETAYAKRFARLERRHRLVRGPDGDTVDIDAEMYTDDMDLVTRDLITLDNASKDRYVVFDVIEDNDVDGSILFRRARLTKQR